MRIDFIAPANIEKTNVQKLLGSQIGINLLDAFEFLLQNTMAVNILYRHKTYRINCPKPSAFIFHKGAVVKDRDTEEKKAKDIYYIYYILRYAPDIDKILDELKKYSQSLLMKDLRINIEKYFSKTTSDGCLLVEKENGTDYYIQNLRNDIYDRFSLLRDNLH
jgi:hypothetical protein